jgi:hypothetical protein
VQASTAGADDGAAGVAAAGAVAAGAGDGCVEVGLLLHPARHANASMQASLRMLQSMLRMS